MFKKICVWVLLFGMFVIVRPVFAETRISESNIDQDTVWDKNGSPYILEGDVTVLASTTLKIEPGTEIIVGNYAGDYFPGLYIKGGILSARGTGTSRVVFKGLYEIYISDGSAFLTNTDIVGSGIEFSNSRGAIATTTISESSVGITTRKSNVSVWGSRIKNNQTGLLVQPSSIFQVKNDDYANAIGGLGNVFATLEEESWVPIVVSITNSSISGNDYAVRNYEENVFVNALNVWWGSSDGPFAEETNRLYGLIDYTPWLTAEPPLDTGNDSVCCSSVLFIPGLQASRLYMRESGILGVGTITNTLWEPNRNDDVRKLFLGANSSSTNTGIYSGGPIDSVLGYGIYDSFMKFLDDIKTKGDINEWKSFGYDWRKNIVDVVDGIEKKADTEESIVDTVISMAKSSKTGKVTLIAHSNGGLVAKYLVKRLADMGIVNTIDSVISVAVPYIGTPKAIASILHGFEQNIAGGLILRSSVARELGANMMGAYGLLPSREYFSKILTPTIAFASSTVVGVNDGSYAQQIKTFEDQISFLADSNNSRSEPQTEDISRPIKANKYILTASEMMHSVLDHFVWPYGITRFAVLGWNKFTPSGIHYAEKIKCYISNIFDQKVCLASPVYEVPKTKAGDGTVLAPSAVYESGLPVAMDLSLASDIEKRNIEHGNILESHLIQQVVGNIIKNTKSDDGLLEKLISLPGVTIGEPDYASIDRADRTLIVSTHSPVSLHIYDAEGNHNGEIAPPSGVEPGLYKAYEKNIPDSDFYQTGNDDSPETYITVPDDGQTYKVVLEGTGVGEFTFDIERRREQQTVDSVEYAGLPVTPLSTAHTIITSSSLAGESSKKLASTSQPLSLDVDGDGRFEIDVIPNAIPDPVFFLQSIRKTVSNLGNSLSKVKQITKKIDRIEELYKKGKLKQAKNKTINLQKTFKHRKLKNLSRSDRMAILSMIEVFLARFDD